MKDYVFKAHPVGITSFHLYVVTFFHLSYG